MPRSDDDKRIVVEGEPSKFVYRVFRFYDGHIVGEPLGEYENLGQLRKHRQRLDRVEVVVQRRKDGITSIPLQKFLKSKTGEPDDA